MKLLALDIGDKWTGTALSDSLGIIASPHKTVESKNLNAFLAEVIAQEKLETIVVGYPKTMRGTESDQTKKVVAHTEQLKKDFPKIKWVLWDERRTSQQAAQLKKAKTKEDKIRSHSIAASFILSSYLDYLAFQKSMQD